MRVYWIKKIPRKQYMEARRIKQLRSRWTVNRWGCICKEDGSLRENLGYAEFLEEGKQVLIFSIRVCAGQSRIAGSYGSSISFFFFFGISILFSTLTEPTYIPTNMVVGFSFLHVLSDTCHSTSFEWHDSERCEICLIMVWFAFPWCLVMLSVSSYASWPSMS